MDIGGVRVGFQQPLQLRGNWGIEISDFWRGSWGCGLCLPAAPTATRCGGIEISAFGGENGGFRVVKEVREDREVRGDFGVGMIPCGKRMAAGSGVRGFRFAQRPGYRGIIPWRGNYMV